MKKLNPIIRRLYNEKYRRDNPEKIKAQNKKYRVENPEKIKNIVKQYHQNHKKKRNLDAKKWRKTNPELFKKIQNKSKKKNRHKNTIKKYLKYFEYGKLHSLTSSQFTRALEGWQKLVKSNCNNKCVICGEISEHAHHIFEKAKYPKLALNINNGIALCRIHHKETHGVFA